MNSMQWWSAPEGQACELHLAFLKQGLTRPASQSSFPPGHTLSQPRYEKGLSPSFGCSQGTAQPGALPPRAAPHRASSALGAYSPRGLCPPCPRPTAWSLVVTPVSALVLPPRARRRHGVISFTALTRCEQAFCGLALYLPEPQGRPRVVVTSSGDGVKLQHRKQWP